MSTRHVQASLPAELVDWFDERFAHGYKQQFIEGCFRALQNLVESEKIPSPEFYSKAAVIEALFGTAA